jgi:hypothetical protein
MHPTLNSIIYTFILNAFILTLLSDLDMIDLNVNVMVLTTNILLQ